MYNYTNEVFPSYSDFDRLVLEECGYSIDHGKGCEIYENAIADDVKNKIFIFYDYDSEDFKQSFGIEDAADAIIHNKIFLNYWNNNILSNINPNVDYILLEQCDDPSFIHDKLIESLNNLKKLEILYYVDFFRNILDIADGDKWRHLIDINDSAFEKMPTLIRLY